MYEQLFFRDGGTVKRWIPDYRKDNDRDLQYRILTRTLPQTRLIRSQQFGDERLASHVIKIALPLAVCLAFSHQARGRKTMGAGGGADGLTGKKRPPNLFVHI